MSNSVLGFDISNLKLPRWMMPGAPADPSGGTLKVSYPPVALEIGTTQFRLARLTKDKEKKWNLTSHDTVEIPAEVLDSEAFKARIKEPERLRALVGGSLQREGIRTRAISVVLPDHFARVALLPFEELPRTRRETIEMVRWKMKKAVPFKVEEAVVDYNVMPAARTEDGPAKGHTLLAVLIPAATVEEHEALFTLQGIHPGLIDLSSFSLANLYRSVTEREVPDGDFMLLNAAAAFFTAMIFRGGRLIFYRCKATGPAAGGNGDAVARTLRREIQASLMYYQERLHGASLARVYMRLVGHDAARITGAFDEAPLASPPEMIDVGKVVRIGGRIAALGPERSADLLQRLAPAVGAALGRSA